jgi:hypothetical protein
LVPVFLLLVSGCEPQTNDLGGLDSSDESTDVENSDRETTDAGPLTDIVETEPDVAETVEAETADGSDATSDVNASGCPIAAASASMSGEDYKSEIQTEPLRSIQLRATRSTDPDGQLQRYEWSLKKPVGSAARLSPNNSAPRPELYVGVPGTYRVELRVFGEDGEPNCGGPAVVTIEVIPTADLYVQLHWNTPSDPDESNNCGSDLDLHYLNTEGDWRDNKWDIFYANKTADWGTPGPPGNPTLPSDDLDGRGPEILRHPNLQSGQTYRLGVYYYRSKGPTLTGDKISQQNCPAQEPSDYGTSYATIRIYIDGQVVYEKEDRALESAGDFWRILQIQWPSGSIDRINEVVDGFPQ